MDEEFNQNLQKQGILCAILVDFGFPCNGILEILGVTTLEFKTSNLNWQKLNSNLLFPNFWYVQIYLFNHW